MTVPHRNKNISAALRRFLPVLSIAVLLPFYADAAEPVSLESLLRNTGAQIYWDTTRHMGRLTRNGTILVFKPGETFIILNGEKIIVAGSIVLENGRVIFSSEAAESVYRAFGMEAENQRGYRLTTILIDPGHGGRDSGAIASWPVDHIDYSLAEKDVVLEISLRVVELLRAEFPEKKILLTRNSDVYPSLEDRVKMANKVNLNTREGMVYVSIHANASLNKKAEGYEVWYLPKDYRRKIVSADRFGEKAQSIAPIVNALWEEEFTNESVRLADMILSGMEQSLGGGVPNRGRREQSWFVVRNARMASVLVEVGFITNKAESGRLRKPDYLKKTSRGLYDGISNFIAYFENREK